MIGRRRIDVARHPAPALVRPIRIAPGAFGPGMPGRMLRLSPDHAVVLEGSLVPIRLLVNGVTIVRVRRWCCMLISGRGRRGGVRSDVRA